MKYKHLSKLFAAVLAAECILQGFTALPVHAEGEEIPIDEEHFPDEGFRNVIARKYDTDGNGALNDQERGVYNVKLEHESSVRSIEGIEYFPEVRGVWCRDCNITGHVDFSKNPEITGIWCSENPITSIDITQNDKLEWIYCYKCDLTELDLSGNPKMGYIEISDNEDLHNIDLSVCPDLEHLIINSCNLEKLDVSHNKNLSHLDALRTGLKELDLGNNPNMKRLDVWQNHGLKVDISGLSGLEFFNCADCDLEELDVSNNPQLMALYCDWNDISTLDLSNNPRLADLRCACNNLTKLDISNNPQLYYLQVFGNRIDSIDLNNNSRLRYILEQVEQGNGTKVYDSDSQSDDYTVEFGGDHEYMDWMTYFISVRPDTELKADNPNDKADVYDSYINTNDGLSSSEDFVTRGEAIQTMYNLAGRPSVGGSSRFTDVDGTFYEDAVIWGEKNYMCQGYPNVCSDTFEGDKTITRQDLALMVHRFAEYKGWLSAFDYGRTDNKADFFDIDYYAWGAFTYAVQWEVVPTVNNHVYPHGRVTTSMLEKGLENFLEHCEKSGSINVSTDGGSGDSSNDHTVAASRPVAVVPGTQQQSNSDNSSNTSSNNDSDSSASSSNDSDSSTSSSASNSNDLDSSASSSNDSDSSASSSSDTSSNNDSDNSAGSSASSSNDSDSSTSSSASSSNDSDSSANSSASSNNNTSNTVAANTTPTPAAATAAATPTAAVTPAATTPATAANVTATPAAATNANATPAAATTTDAQPAAPAATPAAITVSIADTAALPEQNGSVATIVRADEAQPVNTEQIAEVQWERKNAETNEWEEIPGAKELAYVPTNADQGTEVRARIALNDGTEEPVYSESISIPVLLSGEPDAQAIGDVVGNVDESPKTSPRSAIGGVFASIGLLAMAALAVVSRRSKNQGR